MASALLTKEQQVFHEILLPEVVSEFLSKAAVSFLLQISCLLKHGSNLFSDNLDETRTQILSSTSESSINEECDVSQKSRVGITNELPEPETSHRITRTHFCDWLLVAKSDDEDDDDDDEEDAEEEEDEEEQGEDEDEDEGEERESEDKEEGEDDEDDDDDDDDDEEDYEDEDDDDDDDDEDESPPKKLRK